MKKGYKKREHRGVIYKVSCNNHYLFGSTVNFSNRKYQYLEQLKKNKYNNPILQACFNKYGEESVKFEIIQENIPEEILLFVEDIYMGTNNSLVESKKGGMNFKTASRPTLSQETRNKISQVQKGKKLSEETKQKMMGRIPWNKGLKNCLNEESKDKIRNSLKKYRQDNPKIKKEKVKQVGIKGNRVKSEWIMKKVVDINTNIIYNSITEAAKVFNIPKSRLSKYLTGARTNKTTLKFYNQ